MNSSLWIVLGVLLIGMAVLGTLIKRLPLSTAIIYLSVGAGVGSKGLDLFSFDFIRNAALIERVTEVVVIISLFTAGLRLRTNLSSGRWFLPLRLATVSMFITILLLTIVGHYVIGLPMGAAILLGAILAPTDPVLASDVQIASPDDRDKLRFTLTGEAALNDGAAFPFIMLGLGLLGQRELGSAGILWMVRDVLWAVGGGLAIGGILGTLVGHLVLYFRRRRKEAVGLDDLLALGLVALSYGTTIAMNAYGFLAVFAAGLSLRRIEMLHTGDRPAAEILHAAGGKEAEEIATDHTKAPAYMVQTVLSFNEQLERIGEVAVVLLLGAMVPMTTIPSSIFWFAPLLLLIIRPLSVAFGLAYSKTSFLQRIYMSWFGIRGVGSIYYLSYAINQGIEQEVSNILVSFTFYTVCTSIVFHGVSVTPLMAFYQSKN